MITIFSYLVSPGSGKEGTLEHEGTAINDPGKLRDMLESVFEGADDECTTPIAFSSPNGDQSNDTRTELIGAIKSPTEASGRKLAERLQSVTTERSGLGLLFVMVDKLGDLHKIVVSRFPAEVGILADTSGTGLSVEFVERVFMKNALSYKAAVYTHKSLETGLWKGKVVDKQISSRTHRAASYWIKDFLLSDFEMTPQEGTRVLALTLRKAIELADSIEVKQELVSVAALVKAKDGKPVSIKKMIDSYDLSKEASTALLDVTRPPGVAEQVFIFSASEFALQNPFQSLELSNGGFLAGPTDKFSQIFEQEELEGSSERRFTTTGSVIDRKLRSMP